MNKIEMLLRDAKVIYRSLLIAEETDSFVVVDDYHYTGVKHPVTGEEVSVLLHDDAAMTHKDEMGVLMVLPFKGCIRTAPKYAVLSVLVHELVHVHQLVKGETVIESNDDDVISYMTNPLEKEALMYEVAYLESINRTRMMFTDEWTFNMMGEEDFWEEVQNISKEIAA
jgi:hypothetical protein